MPLKTHLDEEPTLNLTPMIDCVFLLLIFFMLGTRFAEAERQIGLKVPEVVDRGTLTNPPQRRMVDVHRDGRLTLDRQPVTLEALQTRLRQVVAQYSDLGVLVQGDKENSFQRMAEVLNACKQAGVKELGIKVRPVPTSP